MSSAKISSHRSRNDSYFSFGHELLFLSFRNCLVCKEIEREDEIDCCPLRRRRRRRRRLVAYSLWSATVDAKAGDGRQTRDGIRAAAMIKNSMLDRIGIDSDS